MALLDLDEASERDLLEVCPQSGRISRPTADTMVLGDCIEVMSAIPDECVDLVFADPPYNLQLGKTLSRPNSTAVRGVAEEWDRFDTLAAYDAFTRRWLAEARRILRPEGSLWVMGSYHNIFRVGAVAQDLGLWILNDVVWIKSNPMPNFQGRRFTNAHETLLWMAREKDAKRYRFNYDALKVFNDGTQMRSDWYLSICGGHERIRGADGTRLHSAQKPEALLYRVLLASTKPGDVVLDPFSGTGTTAAVAKRLGRHWIGIERERVYHVAAEHRVATVEPLPRSALEVVAGRRAAARVTFGQLIEAGFIQPGGSLFGPNEAEEALVRADGSVECGAQVGSIHQVAGTLEGKERSNGWLFWQVRRDGRILSLDVLREEYRALSAGLGGSA